MIDHPPKKEGAESYTVSYVLNKLNTAMTPGSRLDTAINKLGFGYPVEAGILPEPAISAQDRAEICSHLSDIATNGDLVVIKAAVDRIIEILKQGEV